MVVSRKKKLIKYFFKFIYALCYILGQTGFEPATSTSRTSRATNCAIARKKSLPKRKALARAAGLEPAISGVTGQRDNQLRYARVMYSILLKTGACVNRGGRFLLSFLCKILRVLFLDFVFLCVMARKMLVQSLFCTLRILLFKGFQNLFMFLYNSFWIK